MTKASNGYIIVAKRYMYMSFIEKIDSLRELPFFLVKEHYDTSYSVIDYNTNECQDFAKAMFEGWKQ
mgnify:CR=1 FL=1